MERVFEIYEIGEKRATAGNIVRVNEENGFVSIDLAVNRPKDKEPVYLNRITVSKDADATKELVKKLEVGQQIFVLYTEKESEKTNTEGVPYVNRYLDRFWYGRFPQAK